jgi:hypothetical protein
MNHKLHSPGSPKTLGRIQNKEVHAGDALVITMPQWKTFKMKRAFFFGRGMGWGWFVVYWRDWGTKFEGQSALDRQSLGWDRRSHTVVGRLPGFELGPDRIQGHPWFEIATTEEARKDDSTVLRGEDKWLPHPRRECLRFTLIWL